MVSRFVYSQASLQAMGEEEAIHKNSIFQRVLPHILIKHHYTHRRQTSP